MRHRLFQWFVVGFFLAWIGAVAAEGADDKLEAVRAETLKPYAGRSVRGVDVTTMNGKVMCGYQGWFNAEGDGADRGWVHWTKRRGPLADGNAKIDLWPDVSVGAESKFLTYDGLPSDFYLRLTGMGAKLLRGEIPLTGKMPE